MATDCDRVFGPAKYGDRFITSSKFDFDNSYPVGGEALSYGLLGFSKRPDYIRVVPVGGYSFEYDFTNKKLKAMVPVAKFSAALDPASMLTDAVSSLAVTVTGVAATDVCTQVQAAAALEAGLVIQSARVTGANQITVELSNTSAGTVNGASLTADFFVTAANGAAHEVPDTTDLSALTDVIVEAIGKL